MTNNDIITKLHERYPNLSENELEDVFYFYHDDFLRLTYRTADKLNDEHLRVISKMCEENLNRYYSAGISSQSSDGISFTYNTDYSEALLRSISCYRRIVVV